MGVQVLQDQRGRCSTRLRRASGAVRGDDDVAELEQRVEHRRAELATVNEEIRRFAHIVTHDLRSPLVNVMGFTTEIEQSARTMEGLIDEAALDTESQALRETARADLSEAIGFIRSSAGKMAGIARVGYQTFSQGSTARPSFLAFAASSSS